MGVREFIQSLNFKISHQTCIKIPDLSNADTKRQEIKMQEIDDTEWNSSRLLMRMPGWTWYIEPDQNSLVISSLYKLHLSFCVLLKAGFPDSLTSSEFFTVCEIL